MGRSVTFPVHGGHVSFRSTDTDLLDDIVAQLGLANAAAGDGVTFDVIPVGDGRVMLHAAEEWDFPNRKQFLLQLPGVITDFAMRSHEHVLVHAGGVITPPGRVLLVCGSSESGKSTLIGALTAIGCDYLGDELIGIRAHTLEALAYPKPLELDTTSCAVLGVTPHHPPNVLASELRPDVALIPGAAGPIAEVIVPRFTPGVDTEVVHLGVEAAARTLLDQTVNMRRVRQIGLDTVCALAATTPVTRVTHGDSVALAPEIVRLDATGDRLFRSPPSRTRSGCRSAGQDSRPGPALW